MKNDFPWRILLLALVSVFIFIFIFIYFRHERIELRGARANNLCLNELLVEAKEKEMGWGERLLGIIHCDDVARKARR